MTTQNPQDSLLPEVNDIAQHLLQLRVDGQLEDLSPMTVLAAVYPLQPADGLTPAAMSNLMQFSMQLGPCTGIPPARALAAKYGLTIVT